MCVPPLHWYLPIVDENTYFHLLVFSIWSRCLGAEMGIESRNPDKNLFLTKLFWVQKMYYFACFLQSIYHNARFQCPRVLRRGFAAACLLGFLARIPPGSSMSVSRECCVLSGSGLCDGPITRPEESYWEWRVWVWSRNIDNAETPAHQGLSRHDMYSIMTHFSE